MTVSKLSLHKLNNIKTYIEEIRTEIKSIDYVNPDYAIIKLKNKKTNRIRNFYEYYIDGIPLLQKLNEQFWNNTNSDGYSKNFRYNYFWCGTIGSYGYNWDVIKILSLLGELSELNYEKEKLNKYLKLENGKVAKCYLDHAQREIKKVNKSLYWFMGGDDELDGTIDFKIDFDEDFVIWHFSDIEVKLEWIFDKVQYQNTFKILLKYYETYKKNENQ